MITRCTICAHVLGPKPLNPKTGFVRAHLVEVAVDPFVFPEARALPVDPIALVPASGWRAAGHEANGACFAKWVIVYSNRSITPIWGRLSETPTAHRAALGRA
eukprot:8276003-Pyramimonas_sp.AAC.1